MPGGAVLLSVYYQALGEQLRTFLTGMGYVVVEAANPRETLELLEARTQKVDLLLADSSSQDAPALARQALRSRPGLKVLVISGEPGFVNRTLMPQTGIAFLEKPFAWRVLKRKLESLLARRIPPGSSEVAAPERSLASSR